MKLRAQIVQSAAVRNSFRVSQRFYVAEMVAIRFHGTHRINQSITEPFHEL